MDDLSLKTEAPAARFGEGVISFPQAARVIHRPTNTLRSWLRRGLVGATHGRGTSGSDILSFHDLVSLEVIRRLRDKGVSLQRIRGLEVALRQAYPEIKRPFANRVFFTDGASVWVDLAGDDRALLELVGGHRGQLAWTAAIESFADRINYDESGAARSWDLTEHVVIDPAVNFGTPTLRGTRIAVDTVKANLEVASPEEVAVLLGLDVESVIATARSYDG